MKNFFLSDMVEEIQLIGAGKLMGQKLFNFWQIYVITEDTCQGRFAVRKWKGRSLRYQIVQDIYNVFRQALEELWDYGLKLKYGERKRMLSLIEAARELNLASIDLNKGRIVQYESKLKRRVDEMMGQLERARNVAKVEGKEHISEVYGGIDSLGRVNPGALSAAALAAKGDFERRLRQTLSIIPRLTTQLMVAEVVIDLVEYQLYSARHYLSKMVEYIESHESISEKAEKRMVRRLVFILNDLKSITFHPFLFNCNFSSRELNQAINLIRLKHDWPGAAAQMRRSYNSLLYKERQSELEDIILEVASMLALNQDGVDRRKKIYLRVKALQKEIRKIDETKFTRPCKQTVNKLLDFILIYLREGRELDWIKRTLKEASEAMN